MELGAKEGSGTISRVIPMRKILALFLIVFLLLFFVSKTSRADVSCNVTASDDTGVLAQVSKCLDDFNNQLQLSINATKPLEGQVTSLGAQLASIQARVAQLQSNLAKSEADLVTQKKILAATVRSFYINSFVDIPLLTLFSSNDATEALRNIALQQQTSEENKSVISDISGKISKLADEKKSLAALSAQVDRQNQFLKGEIAKAKSFQSQLEGQIASLTARQQDILNQRLASLNIPRSAYTLQGGCVDDRGKDPGFSPAFAFFTYGVPNRIGLNQYGAKGRAEAGQDYGTILKAYYNFDSIGDSPVQTIVVNGTNEYGETFSSQSMNIEDYLKHLYEMPTSWDSKALQAQAIAARSYAAKVQSEKGFLAPSQSDQVVKTEINDGNWQAAVDATKGKVMLQGGSPIKAWFSSTHGGYVLTADEIGWNSSSWTKHATDTNSGSAGSFSDLQNNAYDRSSQWFYCDWGGRSAYSGTAWLKNSEVADIANVLFLASKDSSTRDHLYQTDKANPAGTDTWSEDRVRQELQSRGVSPFSSVSSVTIGADFSAGRVSTVSISGDAGTQSFSGSDFKTYFDLRAPANIQIVGPLYNVEHK